MEVRVVEETKGHGGDARVQEDDVVGPGLEQGLRDAKSRGRLPEELKHVKVRLGFEQYPDGHQVHVEASLTERLRDVFARGASALGTALLPSAEQPLDRLYHREHGHEWGNPLADLDRPLWIELADNGSKRFAVEYVLAVKINTKWGIAPSRSATPRELLQAFGFDPAEFTLYRLDGTTPLPPDTPLSLKRGEMFEAQKDGRYGAPVETERKARGRQTIEDDVEALQEAGFKARLLTQGGQQYVEVCDVQVPSGWPERSASILIAVSATYPAGGLDAFYIEVVGEWAKNAIPRQQSVSDIDGRRWALISWHYATNRPWSPLSDDLLSHVTHCRGFFLNRGVTQ